jgi:hypothetical protein
MKRLNVIRQEVNETFKEFHKETGNKYRKNKNLTIMNMNALKKPTPLEMSNENFNKYVASLSPEEQQSNTILTLRALRRNRFKKTRSGESMKNSFKPENFENFNASVNLKGPAKTKYYKQLKNLKKKALNVFDNKQKRVNLVKGKKLSRANATNIVQGSKLNLK